ncbi:2258_t:CDS:1, partial [Scutellospora calospora]
KIKKEIERKKQKLLEGQKEPKEIVIELISEEIIDDNINE